ncbi:D-alanyl-D-alanine carboxypeptidase family protein [Streptococcus agalactiae]|uniref:D-alanyl-D-alanine carboxypeptidase family protein n=1 Tax=Streptococcus agalactiae TaxID=1311 RepID=UPI00195839E6|nr:serine hydrolase [Streptococcus agalactiae]VTY14375.1 D-alanyl-D-alanine carboxypeptidase DacA [Streptococcus agalactiae]HEN4304589.1 D-alanyl-D-alanine carboxypeptidase [Streptococcus agalactiae]
MPKLIVSFLCILLSLTCVNSVQAEEHKDIMQITREAGYDVKDINKPKASIVIDNKGHILWEDNADLERDPASMSKMFTLYLLFEDLAKGKTSLNTTVTATETDQAISKIYEISNNNIHAGVAYPIRELITMTAVPSSNVATIMIANHLSQNNPDAFIKRINETAKKLGMTKTHFYNPSGAVASAFNGLYSPKEYDNNATNVTTARDLSILTYHFLKKYPDILNYTKYSEVKAMVGTPYEETFTTYNYSTPGAKFGLEGVDGLKTGSSPSAAFNALVTAKRQNTRLITVVLGVGDWSDQDGEYYRHPFVNALVEKGFKDAKNISSKTPVLKAVKPKKEVTKTKNKSIQEQPQTKEQWWTKTDQFIQSHFVSILIVLGTIAILCLLAGIVLLIKRSR